MSSMASPLVCELKGKNGCDGVRLAIDYRYVNQFIVSDAFPIPEVGDVIQKIGGKHWFFGSKLIIHSDHNPITYLTASAPKSSNLMIRSLAQFDIEFQFKAGKMNVLADTLSRPRSGAFDQLGVCK